MTLDVVPAARILLYLLQEKVERWTCSDGKVAVDEKMRQSEAIAFQEGLMASRILRLPAVLLRTGLSRSTVYARVREGTFPRQLSLGPNTVGWRETDIDTWIDGLTSIRTAEGYRAKPLPGPAA